MKKLSKEEMKTFKGGRATLTGWRWDGTNCYCDFAITEGGVTQNFCDIYCNSSNCGH